MLTQIWLTRFGWLRRLITSSWIVYIPLILLLLLILKSPYSERNLISNLEPFPDTFHYLTPPNCWLEGNGWRMCLPNQEGIRSSVSPLYSIYLVPFLAISDDVRVFYFANFLLAVLSYVLLVTLLQQLLKSRLTQALVMLLWVVTYHVYWFVDLAMSENLLVPLTLLLLIRLANKKHDVLTVLVSGLMFLTKFSALPIFLSTTLYVLSKRTFKLREREWIWLVIVMVGVSIFSGAISPVVGALTSLWLQVSPVSRDTSTPAQAWFSPAFIVSNTLAYLSFLKTNAVSILWETKKLPIPMMGLLGIAGYLVAKSKIVWFGIVALIVILVPQFALLSLFYDNNMRYVLHLYPLLLIGIGLLIEGLTQRMGKRYIGISNFAQIVLAVFIFISSFSALRLQVGLNLKHAAQPWWYISLQRQDDFFADKQGSYLITLTSPFYLNYFTDQTFSALPFSINQDFRGSREAIWGISNDIPLHEIYQQMLKDEKQLYLSDYGISANSGFQDEFRRYSEAFKMELVDQGCHNVCNIYKLSLIESN